MSTFFHNVADVTCEHQLSFAGHRYGFDEEQFTADGSVGKCGRDAGYAGTQGEFRFELGWAENFGEVFFGDCRASFLCFCDLCRDVAADCRDASFEVTDACFSCIALYDGQYCIVFNG